MKKYPRNRALGSQIAGYEAMLSGIQRRVVLQKLTDVNYSSYKQLLGKK
jgi:hypothetical protein